MEILLKKRKKKMAYLSQKKKKKNPLQLPNIFVICVCFNVHA